MVLGIISVIIGAIIIAINLFTNVGSAPQQTVQYLGYLIGSLFIVSGLIIITIKNGFSSLEGYLASMQKSPQSSSSSSVSNVPPPPVKSSSYPWTCKKCSTDNQAGASVCKGCGEYR